MVGGLRAEFPYRAGAVSRSDAGMRRRSPGKAVSSKLVESSQRIQVKVINGAARDALDYWDHPEGLNAIAIGGDKLSRGSPLRDCQ